VLCSASWLAFRARTARRLPLRCRLFPPSIGAPNPACAIASPRRRGTANTLEWVRVIAGVYGGRALVSPRGQSTRPTSDRVREALFSILHSVSGARVLDLFAGSGALAIEALSRGASQATLVDSSAAAVTAIKRNLASLQVDAEVRRQTASTFLHGARTAARQYDLVFLDPPYRHASTLGSALSSALVPVLAADARVVAESDRRSPLELELELLDERRYGDTLIQIHGTR
jgi:16S rRNA (guanine966-N2)-methyltransferase